MMRFLRAHGMDPGPLQRPMLAGALSGLAGSVPALAVFVGLGALPPVAREVFGTSETVALSLMLGAFAAAGILYGRLFGRAANDRRGGWLFGASFGFLLWLIAPAVVLPAISASRMASGTAAAAFFACFVLWGLATGGLFPFVHKPLHARMDGRRRGRAVGPLAAVAGARLLRRGPRGGG